MQYDFAKTLLGVPISTRSVHVMAELGFESITVRWLKLHMSFFYHLFSMSKSRNAYNIAINLKNKIDQNINSVSKYSWMVKTKNIMTQEIPALTKFWNEPNLVETMDKLSWKTLTYKLIEHQVYITNKNLPNSNPSISGLLLQPSRYDYLKDLSNIKLHASYNVLLDYSRPGALRLEPYRDD